LAPKNKTEDFKMRNEYWELEIEKANYLEIRFEIKFKDKKLPLSEISKLEETIRKFLILCGRLEEFRPSKRQ